MFIKPMEGVYVYLFTVDFVQHLVTTAFIESVGHSVKSCGSISFDKIFDSLTHATHRIFGTRKEIDG